jgi:hypothetical protein
MRRRFARKKSILSPQEASLFDPHAVPRYLRLNRAIEQYTADMVAHDPESFKSGHCDIRYVVERQLFFALFADKQLHEYFVACAKQEALPDDEDLPFWIRQVAPYFRNSHPSFGAPLNLKSRILRRLYRLHGRASIRTENYGADRARVFFLVTHPKFVRYLRPIGERLSAPYAFLTIEDPEMLDTLRGQNLPAVHIGLTADSLAMSKPEVDFLHEKIRPGFFESWFIRLNAVRRALKVLQPDCIVVPEGNAAVYELVNQGAKAVGIPTVCVQQGWAPIVHPGFRNMSYAGMCVWGQQLAELLVPYNPKQRFVVTGNHIVGYRPQGDVRSRKAIAFFLQNGAHLIGEAVWQSMIELIEWAAKALPDYEIRVREHPGEPLRALEAERLMAGANLRLMPPDKVPLGDVLEHCRVAVTIGSSTILEAVANGVVPLILDTIGLGPYHPDIASDGAAVEVRNFRDAREVLGRLADDDDFCASFAVYLEKARQRLFARNGEQALDAIVAEIRETGGMAVN